ncbi:MAG: hypothetical protein HKO88_01060 [Xanthomonadales bacterium]|nr:hypothetical protein [Xanthomonadales bacterium]
MQNQSQETMPLHRLKQSVCAAALLCMALLSSSVFAALDASLMEGLRARTIGPAAISGRIAAIDAMASNPNHIIVGAATGGVWLSENGGLTWEPVFDDQPVASIGAIAINQSNPDIIWVGSGEGNVRNSTSIGGGVFKSADGGKSWKLMGLEDSERINRIALHPDNPEIAYVAAMGALWGANEERGVYKTTDGGETWKKVLYVNDSTGATDIKIDTVNPDKLFAAMWEFRRWPWHFKSGGEGSGMYITHDGGETWEQRTEEDGLPAGNLGRMAFALSSADPKRVYALVEAEKSALLRSDNGGENWHKVNEEYNVADRPFYYTEVVADPQNADVVYNIGTRVRVSIDGGQTFVYNPVIDCCETGNTIHIDNHAYWINPHDSSHLIFGNDGGIAISRDKGETFRFVRNLPLAQFYHIAVDNDLPYHVYGGLQDNGSWRGPAGVWENGGIRNLHWQEVGFGDGFDTLPDPDNTRSGYGMSQGGNLYRWNLDTGETHMIKPPPPDSETELRFNWNAGLAIDPFDPNTIYYGSQFVHRSQDRGLSWSIISDDLTSNDPAMQTYKTSGGLTADVTAAENYTTIVAIAPSSVQPGVIWAGTDDGRVHVTRDGGDEWSRIDGKARGAAAGAWVPMIFPSPFDAGIAFVIFDDHRRSDMNPYVYRVENYGSRWERLSTDGMEGYALSVLQDHIDPQLLFVGTEFGLHVSTDAGESWSKFTAGVPTVSVMDMAIQERENDLVLGTHGRAAIVIDDYSGLRNLKASDFNERLKILSASPGQQYIAVQTPSTRFTGSGEFRADNEPFGVMLTFMASGNDLEHPDAASEKRRRIALRESLGESERNGHGEDDENDADAAKISVTVKDASGAVIRSYRTDVHQGINRLVWPMRRDGVKPVSRDPEDDPRDGLPPGPMVLPGRYDITLQLGEASTSQSVEILKDPRTTYSMDELESNYETRMTLMGLRNTANTALRQINNARDDVGTISDLIEKQLDAGGNERLAQLKQQAATVRESLDQLEKLYRTPEKTKGITYDADTVYSRLRAAGGFVTAGGGAPSPTALSYVEMAKQTLTAANGQVNTFMTGDLAQFRNDISAAGISLLKTGNEIPMPE